MNKKIDVPINVKFIIDTLWKEGYDSYVVGGCVRDSILGRNPNDWDITTQAQPEEVIKLFDKVILTGVKHGTVTVIIKNEQYEVTTYRCDGEYEDGRHPKQVQFVSDVREDLARRDFTINAIAYNDRNGIIDYFNGINDLNNKVIKTVGDPEKRFEEDALRMLRAVRFSAQLDFSIDNETEEAIKNMSEGIKKISKERIRDELNKTIVSNPEKLESLKKLNLLKYIILNSDEKFNLNEQVISSMKHIDEEVYLRLVMLFYNFREDEKLEEHMRYLQNILRNLKYDNETIKRCMELIRYKNYKFGGIISLKRILNKIGYDRVDDLIKVQTAHILSKDSDSLDKDIEDINNIKKQLKIIIEEKQCFRLKDLKINGSDLIKIGFEKGKTVGSVLEKILDLVIEEKLCNERTELLEYAERILSYGCN